MKKILIYSVIFTSAFILFRCDKPAPTQLVDDTNNDFEVELLNKNLDDQYYNSGLDTSGITQDLTGITNLISVSGIKITNSVSTSSFSLAQAMFFDKSQPIYYSDGKRLLAYKTIIPGITKFDGHNARIVEFKLRYRDEGTPRDTLIGYKYLLYRGRFWQDPFIFNYGSSVSFQFDPFLGNPVSFPIPTPEEISGNVILEGSKYQKNLKAVLHWNAKHEKRISIVISLIPQGTVLSIPVYRFRAVDDGEVIFPKRLLNDLPLENFEKVVVTFIRSYESYHINGNNDLLVSSQSIHSIVIDIP